MTTIGHVAERWAELPSIPGVGRISHERLQGVLGEAAGVAVGAGAEDNGELPF